MNTTQQGNDNKKDWIGYETPTGALISENDYQYLSDNQKEQCKRWYPPIVDVSKAFLPALKEDSGEEVETIYKAWIKETKRSGGILIGGSIHEFLTHLQNHYTITKK